MNTPIAEFSHLSKRYVSETILNDISFSIARGEFKALLGPSGCGKTTTLKLIAGFEEYQKGSLYLNGKPARSPEFLPPEKRNIGLVFQDLALFPHLNVKDNIAFGLKGKRIDKKRRVDELLHLIGMADLAGKMPYMLSGGQQQRVAVARALAPRPSLLLMDEPFSSLDNQLRIQLRNELREILKAEGVATLLVTHDCQEAFSFADRIILMREGSIIQEGTPVQLYHKPSTPWAAEFLGNANFVTSKADQEAILSELFCFRHENECKTGKCYRMIRPEQLSVCHSDKHRCNGHVEHIHFLGDRQALSVRLKSGNMLLAYVDSVQQWSVAAPVAVKARQYHLFPCGEHLTPN